MLHEVRLGVVRGRQRTNILPWDGVGIHSLQGADLQSIVMVHVVPSMIGKCMKAMVDSGLANMDNQQATRLIIWHKPTSASARSSSQLPYDCEYVVMGIHSIDKKLPADLYQCWFDRHKPGYPGSTVVEVPRIGSHTLDEHGGKVNKTENNPFGAYMVTLLAHIFISEFDKTHPVACQYVMS